MEFLHDIRASQDRPYGSDRSDAPGRVADELQDQVEALLDEGYPRDTLYEQLKQTALRLRGEGREDLEDEVLEVMDVLSGWCPPPARI